MVNNWHRNALIEFKCDVFFKTFKLREFRNSLGSAGKGVRKKQGSPEGRHNHRPPLKGLGKHEGAGTQD